MTERHRYNVGAYKIPFQQRDIAHAAITPDDPRGFLDVIGADDDPGVPDGTPVTYSLDLTDEEAKAFRRATNCRYVERDGAATVDVHAVTAAAGPDETIPPLSTMTWMGADPELEAAWHGRDTTVAVLDGGTTRTVRDRFGWQLVAHRNFVSDDQNPDVITVDHGCMVSPLAVPAGGRLVQGVVFDEQGSARWSWIAAAIRWAADAGAQVINFSGSGPGGGQVLVDALAYLADRGVVLVASAGNDGMNTLGYPAAYSETHPNVYSSIAFGEASSLRAGFSNYKNTGSGCAPGESTVTVNAAAENIRASGTSFSAPHMARLVAMAATGGRWGIARTAAALRESARDTDEPVEEEGAGAWHLGDALAALAAAEPTPGPAPDPLAGFPYAELDSWSARARPWWTRYSRSAAAAYTRWRRSH